MKGKNLTCIRSYLQTIDSHKGMLECTSFPRACPMALGYGLPPCNENSS